VSIGKLIEEEAKVTRMVEQARQEAELILKKAEEEARKLVDVKRISKLVEEYMKKEEAKIRKEAEALRESYKRKLEKLSSIPEEKLREIAEKMVMEVLGLAG